MNDAGDNNLVARDLAVFWHPCAQMQDLRDFAPLVVTGARGCRLQLQDGRVVLDGIASWWCKSLGHGHPRLRAALAAQLDAFEHVITGNTTNAPLVRLCERLIAAANGLPPAMWGEQAPSGRQPGHFGKVFLAENGSTAVEIALKMALQAQAQRGQPQRKRFAAFANGYHGETVGALSVGSLGLYGEPYAALMFPVKKLGPLPTRSGPDDPRWMDPEPEWSALEAMLTPIAAQLAAIIYEPVLQAAGGMRLYSPALLHKLQTWAQSHDVFLIADEIAAGMGRLGPVLASHLPGVASGGLPDFAVLSKGLTGGFLPLSAVLTTDAVYDLFLGDHGSGKAFLHSNTHTGNALAVAVALAALNEYATGGFRRQLRIGTETLRAAMRDLCARRPHLLNLRTAGLVAAFDVATPDGRPPDATLRTGLRICREATRRGLLIRPLGDTLYLFPPLNTASEDLRTMVALLGEAVDAVCTP